MLISDLIERKKNGGRLSRAEIDWMVSGYTRGDIPDYQMSAMLMAIWFKGMDEEETYDLTMSMLRSGETLDLSAIEGVKADKHSTGGVGDKTSLILCPMVAACGVKMAKLSGRGLGHSGGTIDKLESFHGLSTALPPEEFFAEVNNVGFAIAGQTGDLCPADKKLYALRDVTGTVDSRPLIVSSIMSKKLAAGADVIVLDVKSGSGSFMHTEEDAFALARELVSVGSRAGKRVAAVVTDMDRPLGMAVGNALEVKEAVSVLKGETGGNLLELCLALGAEILTESGAAKSETEARDRLLAALQNGKALERFAAFVEAQGGDPAQVYDTSTLPQASIQLRVPAYSCGYVNRIAADGIGAASVHLGSGRSVKDAPIDLSAGIVLQKQVGDYVNYGESVATVHASDEAKGREAVELVRACFTLADVPPVAAPLVKGIVRAEAE